VQVIPEFEDDYYFIHITDSHCPTHLFYYQNGSETDSSEITDLREVIADVNIINPAFVLLTGDLINEGELEDFLGRRYFSRCQRLLTEFQVPVYLTAGNHDIGGWGATPPPAGTARRTWWRFFGWERLDSPPAGAPARTQDYSFDYGPVHYTGLEAYNNYDGWRPAIYGSDSFTSSQMQWLAQDLEASAGSAAHVLFYHSDFRRQINLASMGVDMALSGHTHSNSEDYSYPYNIVTASTCDGTRAYRLVRVSQGTLAASPTIYAGSTGKGLSVEYAPANDGSSLSVTATITNTFGERFEHGQLRFLMPNRSGLITVTGGTLLQVENSGPYAICYVGVDIARYSTQTVALTLESYDTEAPTVTVTSPNGGEVWNIGTAYDITWTADDNVGVTSVSILRSSDGGLTFADTLATGEANDGTYSWAPTGPATPGTRIKVIARDAGLNAGQDWSDADFEVHDPTAGIPPRVVIESASPNPFSQHTVIRFGVPGDGLAEIDLYDVSGHLVTNLARKQCTAGYQQIEWTNDGQIGAGVYFIRLRLGSQTAARKVVIPR
jgi:predicted MPP superfamily phosphohydrolase